MQNKIQVARCYEILILKKSIFLIAAINYSTLANITIIRFSNVNLKKILSYLDVGYRKIGEAK